MAKASSYVIGFILALILTAIPFGLVALHAVGRTTGLAIISGLALAQILVHLRFFLHVDPKTTTAETLFTLIFTAVLIFILVGGSLWIMFDLNERMASAPHRPGFSIACQACKDRPPRMTGNQDESRGQALPHHMGRA